MDDIEVLNVYELMEQIQVGKNVAYQLLNSGSIKAFRIGRTWKIPRNMVNEFILHSAKEKIRY
jgi:excisionase family DNA binding protein